MSHIINEKISQAGIIQESKILVLSGKKLI